ncbi:MAG: hypothetical protein JWO49_2676 [Arthrobacter sp.]|nr:hypothetical protein [Arthrobacter sp.]
MGAMGRTAQGWLVCEDGMRFAVAAGQFGGGHRQIERAVGLPVHSVEKGVFGDHFPLRPLVR